MSQGTPCPSRGARKFVRWMLTLVSVAGLLAASGAHGDDTFVVVAGETQDEDVSATLSSVEDALHRHAEDADPSTLRHLPWRQGNPALTRGGTSRSQWLLRVALRNLDDTPRERVLLVRHPTLDAVHLTVTCGDSTLLRARSGDRYPALERATLDRHPAFLVTLPANARCEAWFSVNTDDAFQFPLWLMDTRTYNRFLLNDYLQRGLTLGMQLLAVCVGLLLALQRRDAVAGAFAVAVASQSLLVLVLSDLGYVLFWGPAVQVVMAPAATALCWVLTATLCLKLLPEDAVHWLLRRLVQITLLLACFAALAQVVAPDPGRMATLVAACAVGMLLLLVATVGAVMMGAAHAGLVTAAITAFTLGGLIEACGYLGILALGTHYLLPMQAGFLLATLLLGIALWHRLADGQRRRGAERDVDRRVAERTRALTSTVAELTSVNRRLDRLSSSDMLTGTFNRRFMDVCLQRYAADPVNAPLSFILFDIDFFKQVNDRHGHPAGDRCLQVVADCVQRQLRQGKDVLCRYGGEEFAVILPNTDLPGAEHVAEKIRQAVAGMPVRCPSGQELRVTISLGVSMLPAPGDPENLIDAADRALYGAKRNGRNRWQVATA